MKLTVLGCSGSYAGPDSPASSYLVQEEFEGRTWSIVMDLGNGAFGALQRHADPFEVDAILISHLHPDHCADLSGLYVHRHYHPQRPDVGRLAIWGPPETAERMDLMYHGLEDGGTSAEFDVSEVVGERRIEVGPFTITPYAVNHPIEAFGFRIETDSGVLAYSGDTDTCDTLTPLMTGADLVLCEAAFVEGRDEIRDVHLTGRRAAQAAVAAGGVGRLVLTHIPAWNDADVCREQAAEVWPGDVELAVAGATYEVGRPGSAH